MCLATHELLTVQITSSASFGIRCRGHPACTAETAAAHEEGLCLGYNLLAAKSHCAVSTDENNPDARRLQLMRSDLAPGDYRLSHVARSK